MSRKRVVQEFRLTRIVLAMLAVAIVVALVASVVTAPSVDRSQERTDPAIAVPSAVPAREEPASRNYLREPLAVGPSASASASPSPSQLPSPSPSPSPSESPSKTPEAAPSPSPTPSETPTPKPAPSVPELGSVVGEVWATGAVNVRSGPGTGFGVLTTVRAGDAVTATNVLVDDRWQQVRIGERVGFVSSKYLTDDEPAEPSPAAEVKATAEASATEEASEGGVSTASCRVGANVESGLTSRTRDALRSICNEFPSVKSYGGYRSGGGSYHSQGRAIDVMISGEAGWEVARWVRSNAGELGVIEVIYAQRIWTAQRSGEGWRSMSDRGSSSANHYDHVHVSVR